MNWAPITPEIDGAVSAIDIGSSPRFSMSTSLNFVNGKREMLSIAKDSDNSFFGQPKVLDFHSTLSARVAPFAA